MSAGGFIPGLGTGPKVNVLPTTTVELSVKCTDLCDMDVFSKSDPVCVLFQKSEGKWLQVNKTEAIENNLNPEWQTKFVIDYNFEERQEIKFEIYDWDSKSKKLSMHDFLGKCETTLGSIVAAKNHQFVSMLRDPPRPNKSKIFVSSEEMSNCKDLAVFEFGAEKLDNKDLFGKSDPFFVISKLASNGMYTLVYRSTVIMNNLNPSWKPFKIKVRDLCNGDFEKSLKIDIFDWDSDGKHDMIGTIKTSFQELKTGATDKKGFPVINESKKQRKSSYKNSGMFYVKSFLVETCVSFLDYIQNGTAMNFSIAVDFTASNGDPRDPRSLHYRDPNTGGNQYSETIRAVGQIIEDYDDDRQYPAFGFGARVPPSGKVSDEFFLNLRQDTPYCLGVEGVIEAYQYALQNVTLYGPTNFSPVINHVAKFAAYNQDGRNYYVLLILTDGIITDLELTVEAIVRASTLPLSIIIIGVGDEDFSAMKALDCDDGLLKSGRGVAARDIVQFVEIKKFINRDQGDWNRELLAKHVLAEVPQQVVQWMKIKGIKPGTAGS